MIRQICLLGFVLFASCEIDTDLSADASQDASQDASEDSMSGASLGTEEGVPPIDDVTYEETEVATFALG